MFEVGMFMILIGSFALGWLSGAVACRQTMIGGRDVTDGQRSIRCADSKAVPRAWTVRR